jgi:hypothetical protein
MKFVDKQLALKLKEKGFDKPCINAYNAHGCQYLNGWCEYLNERDTDFIYSSDLHDRDCLCPTIDQVLEWLREDCGLYIATVCSRNYDIDADGRVLGSWVYWWYEIYAHLSANLIYQEEEKEYDTYDEAILEGIEYVINNLI